MLKFLKYTFSAPFYPKIGQDFVISEQLAR